MVENTWIRNVKSFLTKNQWDEAESLRSEDIPYNQRTDGNAARVINLPSVNEWVGFRGMFGAPASCKTHGYFLAQFVKVKSQEFTHYYPKIVLREPNGEEIYITYSMICKLQKQPTENQIKEYWEAHEEWINQP